MWQGAHLIQMRLVLPPAGKRSDLEISSHHPPELTPCDLKHVLKGTTHTRRDVNRSDDAGDNDR